MGPLFSIEVFHAGSLTGDQTADEYEKASLARGLAFSIQLPGAPPRPLRIVTPCRIKVKKASKMPHNERSTFSPGFRTGKSQYAL